MFRRHRQVFNKQNGRRNQSIGGNLLEFVGDEDEIEINDIEEVDSIVEVEEENKIEEEVNGVEKNTEKQGTEVEKLIVEQKKSNKRKYSKKREESKPRRRKKIPLGEIIRKESKKAKF